MYCGQCGKRVLDDMLFCPFCGSPIVIPDQDEPVAAGEQQMPPSLEFAGNPDAENLAAREREAEEQLSAHESAEQREAVSHASAAETELDSARNLGDGNAEATAESWFAAEDDRSFVPLRFEEQQDAVTPKRETEAMPRGPVSLFDDMDAVIPNAGGDASDGVNADESFAPLEIGEAVDSVQDDLEDAKPILDEFPRRKAPQRRAPLGGTRSITQTFIPVRDVNPNDMFMDGAHPATVDDYDSYDDDADADGGFDNDFSFEDAEPEDFLRRHIRSMVGMILLLALLLIFLIWAAMPAGQRVLASSNLAWSAQAYSDLGYEAYKDGQYHTAAGYFERALVRDGDNYNYAHSAMVAYYEAGENNAALSMLKRCIDMDPDNPEPYIELLTLYPDATSRPWDVRQLLRQGYERTGEVALNVEGESPEH